MNEANTFNLVDALCYLYPHREELHYSHPAMKGTWKACLALSYSRNTFFAPLLVDDIKREGSFATQTVDQLIANTIGKKFKDLPWFGHPVSESEIEHRYGDLGCKKFDSIYHRDIILSVATMHRNWKWIAVQPETFKSQQSGMLIDLWEFIYGNVNFNQIANGAKVSTQDTRDAVRDAFLLHFEHHWIASDGTPAGITHPVYHSKKITHQPI